MALLPEIRRTTGGALGFRRPVPPEICELASRRSELPGLDLVTLHLEVQGLVVHLEEPSRLTLVFFRWLEGTSRAGDRSRHRCPNYSSLTYSGSAGLLKSTPSFMLPCPACGKLVALGFPGSRFDAVSSGGKSTSELRKSSTAP